MSRLMLVFCSLAFVNGQASVEVKSRNLRSTEQCSNLEQILRNELRVMEKSLEKKMMMFSVYTQNKKNGDDLRLMLKDLAKNVKSLETEIVYMEKRMRRVGEDSTNKVISFLNRLRQGARPTSQVPQVVTEKPSSGSRGYHHQSVNDTRVCSGGFKWIGRGQLAKCIRFSHEKKTFRDAEIKCRSDGGHLISIKSEEERRSLTSYLIYFEKVATTYTDGIWIGLRNNTRNGQWTWTDGSYLDTSWSYWELLQPDGRYIDSDGQESRANDACVYMALNRNALMKWSDTGCELTLPFVCQRRVEIEQ